MPRCDFCGKEYPPHMGIKFILTNGKIYNFCSKKCRKSFDLQRDPRSTKWTETYRTLKEEESET